MKISIIIFSFLVYVFSAGYAQSYLGGSGQGHSNSIVFNNVCVLTNILPIPYLGGSSDGHSNSIVFNNVCVLTNILPIPYLGGNSDGHSNSIVFNNVCALTNALPIPYLGGSSDGHSDGGVFNVLFANGFACSSLPVRLLSFSGSCENNKIQLLWTTASEINNDYFTIELSSDGINYQVIGTVDGSGNSTTQKHYKYIYNESANPAQAPYYYRLKQTDFDGNYEYSGIIAVNNDCVNFEKNVIIYPNPSEGIFFIRGEEIINQVTVFNMLGEKIFEQRNINSPFVEINISQFSDGMYITQINYKIRTINKQIILVSRLD